MAARDEPTGDEHRYFVQPDAPVSEDDEAPTVEAPPVEVEISGLRRIQAGAIAGLIGIALGALAPLYLVFIVGIALNTSSATGGSASAAYMVVEALVFTLFTGIALLLVSFGLYIAGFAKLRRADARFGAPMGLAIVGLIGFLLVVGFVGFLFAVLLQVLSCGGPGVAKATCVTLASGPTPDPTILLGGLAVGVVGWVGLILGLYRVGKRYASTITRIGAILYAVPLANVAAPALIVVGASGIVRRLRAGAPAPSPAPEPAPLEEPPAS